MGLNMEPRQGGTTALRKETEQQNSSHVAAPFWDTLSLIVAWFRQAVQATFVA